MNKSCHQLPRHLLVAVQRFEAVIFIAPGVLGGRLRLGQHDLPVALHEILVPKLLKGRQ
jgi:hypothetical protein